MGKGRQIASTIMHNYYVHGVKRAVWVTTSSLLIEDAKRDMNALTQQQRSAAIPIESVSEFNTKKPLSAQFSQGILFITYSLISRDWSKKIQWISSWLQQGRETANDPEVACGTIILDESHKCKNMLPGNTRKGARWGSVNSCSCGKVCSGECNNPEKHKGSKTGIAIWHLQNALPNACVLYASATSFSEVRNIAPMSRLCLWGKNTPFRNFLNFEAAINPRDKKNHPGEVPMMEIVGRDLYARGLYSARMISYHDIEFSVEDIVLEESIQKGYNRAVVVQWEIYNAVVEAVDCIANCKAKSLLKSQYWGQNQRFFQVREKYE